MSEFNEDVRKLRELYSGLLRLRGLNGLAFEERFHLLYLRFPLELVKSENFQPEKQNPQHYCLFVSEYGIYHLPLQKSEVAIAEKIKMRAPLSREEKSAALSLMCKLAVGRIEL
jgi:hypothetical protein